MTDFKKRIFNLEPLCNSYISHLDDDFKKVLVLAKFTNFIQSSTEKNYDILYSILGVGFEGVSTLDELLLHIQTDLNDPETPKQRVRESHYPYIIKKILEKHPEKQGHLRIYTSKVGSLILAYSQPAKTTNQ